MGLDFSPLSPSGSRPTLIPRRWRSFLRSNSALKIGSVSIAVVLTGLIAYESFFSLHGPSWHPVDWRRHPSHFDPDSLELADPSEILLVDPKYAALLSEPTPPPSPPAPPVSDVLTLEQIRDIVATTRGFFARDYSLHLGWNNMRYILEAALLQAELLNRTLVLPSFVYARACEYDITVCADYATMVNKGDAIGSDEWRQLPIEQQMGYRLPISVMVNITHLRSRQPVITVSEYLRLHGQDPESESGNGHWLRESYHTHPNVFGTDTTRTPSLFVIENHWYDPGGTNRVDYIPEAMKWRGNLDSYPQQENYDGGTEYWPPHGYTELSSRLAGAMDSPRMDWDSAKGVVVKSFDLDGEVNLEDDEVVEEILHEHGWEVLYTFPAVVGMDFAKTVVGHVKEVVPRSSIRGFRDDYYDVDADVVLLVGETHVGRKPGTMRFTEELSRNRFASTAVFSLIPPQKIIDLAEVLSSRMLLRTGGRMWMGAHMRRGDFVRFGWAMESDPEHHARRVKERLERGRLILTSLRYRHHWTTCDFFEGAQPNPEQTTLLPPRAADPFFVATDERDPDTRRMFAAAGAVFMSDLLTMEDRQAFGWPLMITDVMALVEQQLLALGGFYYGHCLSSFSGVVINLRAGRGADPRTMLLD